MFLSFFLFYWIIFQIWVALKRNTTALLCHYLYRGCLCTFLTIFLIPKVSVKTKFKKSDYTLLNYFNSSFWVYIKWFCMTEKLCALINDSEMTREFLSNLCSLFGPRSLISPWWHRCGWPCPPKIPVSDSCLPTHRRWPPASRSGH